VSSSTCNSSKWEQAQLLWAIAAAKGSSKAFRFSKMCHASPWFYTMDQVIEEMQVSTVTLDKMSTVTLSRGNIKTSVIYKYNCPVFNKDSQTAKVNIYKKHFLIVK
jgi:hypothetical protein